MNVPEIPQLSVNQSVLKAIDQSHFTWVGRYLFLFPIYFSLDMPLAMYKLEENIF